MAETEQPRGMAVAGQPSAQGVHPAGEQHQRLRTPVQHLFEHVQEPAIDFRIQAVADHDADECRFRNGDVRARRAVVGAAQRQAEAERPASVEDSRRQVPASNWIVCSPDSLSSTAAAKGGTKGL